MTEAQVRAAKELLDARREITEFVEARNPESPLLAAWAQSTHEHIRKAAAAIPKAETVQLQIMKGRGSDAGELVTWALPRPLVEDAMRHALEQIEIGLELLGVTP
jgi:hypothetical protein